MGLDEPKRVLKIPVAEDPVLLKAEETVRRESETEAERILREAAENAEQVKRLVLEAAAGEREKARREADRILREAEEKREELIGEALREARENARAEVMEEFRPRIVEAVERFERVVREAEQAWRGCLDQHKNEVVELALEIARRVVHRISESDRDLVRRTAEAALAKARERQSLILRVHPEDLEILRDYEIELLGRFEDIQTLKIEEDRRVDRGGVWIETPSGFIDARIRNQLDELMEAVLPAVERPAGPEEGDHAGE